MQICVHVLHPQAGTLHTPRRIAGGIAHFDLHGRVAFGDILDATQYSRHVGELWIGVVKKVLGRIWLPLPLPASAGSMTKPPRLSRFISMKSLIGASATAARSAHVRPNDFEIQLHEFFFFSCSATNPLPSPN